MKQCCTCKEIKAKREFHKDNTKSTGLHSQCKECSKKRLKAHIEANPDYHRNNHYKKLYGITVDVYNKIFEDQQGCCAICGAHSKEFTRSLAVDHCHTTGVVRGLLCTNCNTAIGKLKEDPTLFLKAIEYLTNPPFKG